MSTRSCPVCSRSVPDDVPMIRAQVSTQQGRRRWYAWEAVCTDCLQPGGTGARSDDRKVAAWAISAEVDAPVPCQACGLPVVLQPDKRRKVATCSDRCRSRFYTERARRVAEPATLACAGCGQTMSGRADRRYCSSACRQRAYRRRTELTRLGVPAEDAGRVDRLGALDAEQFEQLLQRARDDGDLSAQHVDRLTKDMLGQV